MTTQTMIRKKDYQKKSLKTKKKNIIQFTADFNGPTLSSLLAEDPRYLREGSTPICVRPCCGSYIFGMIPMGTPLRPEQAGWDAWRAYHPPDGVSKEPDSL